MRLSLVFAIALALGLASTGPLSAQTGSAPSAQDGPFGFRMGMSRDSLARELRSVTEARVSSHQLVVKSAPHPYAQAEGYILTFGSSGLCKVVMVTLSQERDAYGDKLRAQFTAIHDALTARYGKSKDFDFLRAGSIWNEPREWMMALRQDERTLASFWDHEEGSDLPPSLKSVSLSALAQSGSEGYLRVAYDFTNIEQCTADAQRAQRSVF